MNLLGSLLSISPSLIICVFSEQMIKVEIESGHPLTAKMSYELSDESESCTVTVGAVGCGVV